jgi:hypothetical protein
VTILGVIKVTEFKIIVDEEEYPICPIWKEGILLGKLNLTRHKNYLIVACSRDYARSILITRHLISRKVEVSCKGYTTHQFFAPVRKLIHKKIPIFKRSIRIRFQEIV